VAQCPSREVCCYTAGQNMFSFYGHEGSVPRSQNLSTGPYLEPVKYSPHPKTHSSKILSTLRFVKWPLPFRSSD